MVIDRLKEITTDQLLLLIAVTQERLDATQQERGVMQQELDDREADNKWNFLLKQTVAEGTPMWQIEQRAKADIAANRVTELVA